MMPFRALISGYVTPTWIAESVTPSVDDDWAASAGANVICPR